MYTKDNIALVKKNIKHALKNTSGNTKKHIVHCKQVHGKDVKVIKCDEILPSDLEINLGEYDAIITNREDTVLFTYHADCFAIFFFDPSKKIIGLAHAGWKGVYHNVSKEVIKKMVKEFGTNPSDLLVYISPGIQQCCFEVSSDISDQFLKKYDWSMPFIKYKQNKKAYINLQEIIKYQLENESVEDIDYSNLCTCCEEKDFFSYRRDGEKTGRMGAFLQLLGGEK